MTTTTPPRRRARRGSLDISEARVHEAADMLVAEGQDPTIDQVREKLGGGSYTPIGNHLKSWRAARRPVLTTVDADLPDELSRMTKEAASAMWHRSNLLASEKIKTVEDAANDRIREAQVDRAALEKEIESLETELDEKDESLESVTTERDQLHRELQDLKVSHAELVKESEGQKQQLSDHKDHLQKLEKAHTEAATDYKERITKLEQELVEATETLEDERKAFATKLKASEEVSANLAADLSTAKKSLKDTEAKAHDLEQSFSAIKSDLLTAQKNQAKQEGIVSEQSKRVDSLLTEVENSRSEAKKWEDEALAIREEKKALKSKLESLDKIKEDYTRTSILLEERTTNLEKLERKYDSLTQTLLETEKKLAGLSAPGKKSE